VPKVTDEAWWEVTGEPVFDRDGLDCAEYQIVGSYPLSAFEVMVMQAAGVSNVIDLEMEYLR